MRTIKFRAYGKKEKRMDKLFGITQKEVLVRGLTGVYSKKRENVELMQYTGLKDGNNKEIYEGDVVVSNKVKTDTCVVKWASGLAGWLLDTRFEGSMGTYQLNSHVSEMYKVIGNIWENGDLIK